MARPVVTTGPGQLRVSVALPLPPPGVWRLLTEAAHVAVWWSEHLTLQPALDGRVREMRPVASGWRLTTGRIVVFDPPSVLDMTWAEDPWPGATRLVFQLAGGRADAMLVLTHRGWDVLPVAGRAELMAAYAAYWGEKLGLLAAYAADSA